MDISISQHDDENDMLTRLPKEKGWRTEHLYQYKSFCFTLGALKGVKSTQQCFKTEPTDIFLATSPKSGTTWFKALTFAIMNRDRFDFSSHPLLTNAPHDNLPYLEAIIRDEASYNDYRISSSPHCLFATHIPYSLLPISVMSFGCKIVYVFREAKDVFISNWHYMKKLRPKDLPSFPMEEAFDLFCKGVSHYGPFWDHVLGYWNASLENPDKVLFLNYEDMKKDPVVCVTKLAKFLDKPFCLEEEREEVVQKIVRLCSFENLSSLEVNKTGVQKFGSHYAVENRHFLRKGEVGDWRNHLTVEMAQQLDEIIKQKLGGTGLNC
ncbi:flavonol sulfotransferase-like [Solanum dulcamara]|uniref:flavonol sulfotransferase-like n=1 Tax=Solanum dulcamara TaxID=45834 RepID=UPI002485766E|nr:flavonol sulfotransferase-like [Solanum dulcamara]